MEDEFVGLTLRGVDAVLNSVVAYCTVLEASVELMDRISLQGRLYVVKKVDILIQLKARAMFSGASCYLDDSPGSAVSVVYFLSILLWDVDDAGCMMAWQVKLSG